MASKDPFLKNLPKPFLDHIPGDKGMPFFGDVFHFLKDPFGMFQKKQKKYGDVFKMSFFGQPTVCLIGHEANRFVLVEQGKYFSNHYGWEDSIGELFEGGLMLKDGEDHKLHRSILQVAFKKEPYMDYLEAMIPLADQYLEGWKNKDHLVVFDEMKQLTLKLAGKVFFGLDFSKDLEKINKAIIEVVKASTVVLPYAIPFSTYWYGLRARKTLEKYFHALILEKRKNPSKDMLGALCMAKNEEGEQLSNKEIVDHLIFILMASHDTTASTMSSLFYELAVNPAWQEKLRAESQSFYAQYELTYQNLDHLTWMDLAIKETLRMHPPLILIPRFTTQDMEYNGIKIPAHTRIMVYLNQTHYSNEIWENPESFHPERFSENVSEHKKCPHAYMPFGGGKHFCLGFGFAEMQMKMVMSKILTHYRWELIPGYKAGYKPVPIQEPLKGLPVKISALK